MREYQRRRRAMERPCQGCGAVMVASQEYRATAAADPIRCCPNCYAKIAGALGAEPSLGAWLSEAQRKQELRRRYLERVEQLVTAGVPLKSAQGTARRELTAAGLLAAAGAV